MLILSFHEFLKRLSFITEYHFKNDKIQKIFIVFFCEKITVLNVFDFVIFNFGFERAILNFKYNIIVPLLI
jgi:hypothetical protein